MYQLRDLLNKEEKYNLYDEYFKLIKKSAYSGYAEALYDLAQQYEDTHHLYDINPKYNPKKCIFWYKKACKKNHAEACNNLAHFYELGIGCKKNIKRALSLYKKSSDLGYNIGTKNYKLLIKQLKD